MIYAALGGSSVGLAVCDQDFTVRFFNPALARLIGNAGASAADAMQGPAVLRSLGVDVAAAMAELESRGGWNGIAEIDAPGGLALLVELHVTVEAFDIANNAAGWLITARTCIARPEPISLTDLQLIALSDKLTPRECEVVVALQEGESNKAIARRLDISPRTVEFHRARIMQRFAATSVVDLVRKVTRDALAAM